MTIAKIVICILILVAFKAAQVISDYGEKESKVASTFGISSIVLLVTLVILCIISWNCMNIAYILSTVGLCFVILMQDPPRWRDGLDTFLTICISFVVIVVVFGITIGFYVGGNAVGIEEKTEVYTYDLVSAGNSTTTEENYSISKGIIVMQITGSTEEEDVYKFYYKEEDGAMEKETIPSKGTKIYYIDENEVPYVEKTVTTSKKVDKHKHPDKIAAGFISDETSEKVTYKLYVPKDSIVNTFEFDTN